MNILSVDGRIEINPKLLLKEFKGSELKQQGFGGSCWRVPEPKGIIREKGVMKVISIWDVVDVI